MKTVDEIMSLVREYGDACSDDPKYYAQPNARTDSEILSAIEAALKEREGEAVKMQTRVPPHDWVDFDQSHEDQLRRTGYVYTTPPKAQPMSDAATDVLKERERQIGAEGWTPEHDDSHSNGQLAHAAAAYAHESGNLSDGMKFDTTRQPPFNWPWERSHWKVADSRRMLVKAGALILAEIERTDRAAERHHKITGE